MSCCFKDNGHSHSKKLQKKTAANTRNHRSTKPTSSTNLVGGNTGPIVENFQEAPKFLPTTYDVDALVLELNSNDEWEWSGGHRLSAIEEIRSERSQRDSGSVHDILEKYTEKPNIQQLNRDYDRLSRHLRSRPSFYNHQYEMSAGRSPGRSPERPRPIEAPPTDLETVAKIDASLIFEHFTTDDAWLLGSTLRNRLLTIPTPVVINISLANQNQTLFHAVTHSGTVPDNEQWVARKRKTVLRFGKSTWYMHCKYKGDEKAFAATYGLGPDAGSYAIHGGGVPIRVVGVEGIVAVVVVSGLKQHEDHGVIVECIRELYY